MLYEKHVRDRLSSLAGKEIITLGIETSCDDTSAAVLRGNGEVLSLCVHSQVELHNEYGGVVPELASRDHVKNLRPVVSAAIKESGLTPADIDAVAVTCMPGLLGALLTGLSFAKGLAFALGVPLLGVNHISGHIAANYLTNPELKPPFVCLVASGGHSQIIHVKDYNEFSVMGGTCDDAAGEAFDKIARALGLPYPGGPHLEELAKSGDENAFGLRSPFNESKGMDFSFSGIKTAAVNLLLAAKEKGAEVRHADIAASFQRSVTDTLSAKTVMAAKALSLDTVAMAGGVSSNSVLRAKLEDLADQNGMRFFCPAPTYCTDNAAMIACAGYHMLRFGLISELALDAKACAV